MIRVVKGFTKKPTGFYVYTHRKLDTMEVFYVGKGTKYRAWYTAGRSKNKNTHWVNTAKKHGVYVEIIQDRLQEWYALELEKEIISKYGRQDLKEGTLVNKSNGGESGSGVVFSDEYKLNSRKNGIKFGKRVVINNQVCMFTIKDAARYLLPLNYSKTQFRTACSAISNCVNKVVKSYRKNIIHFVGEDYEEVAKLCPSLDRDHHSDSVIREQHSYYLNNTKTIVKIAAELELSEGYVQCLFKGMYRSNLKLILKTKEDFNKFDNSSIIHDLKSMTAIDVMKKYNISKTHLYRLKRADQ